MKRAAAKNTAPSSKSSALDPQILAQMALRFDDIRRKVPAWADKEHDEDWDYIVRTVIERAWRGVRGQG